LAVWLLIPLAHAEDSGGGAGPSVAIWASAGVNLVVATISGAILQTYRRGQDDMRESMRQFTLRLERTDELLRLTREDYATDKTVDRVDQKLNEHIAKVAGMDANLQRLLDLMAPAPGVRRAG
jgi:hypothetical protein